MKLWYRLLSIIIIINISSCSTESNIFGDSNLLDDEAIGIKPLSPEKIAYASTISNLISTFPKFKNDAVNLEVSELKNTITDYIYSVQSYNSREKDIQLKKFEKTYRSIQKLRKYLKYDDDQVLNRYLVKLKTTISLLESVDQKENQDIISTN